MSEHYILQGRKMVPATLEEWGRWLQEPDAKRVGLTHLDGGVKVSTVFLGIDHGYGHGPAMWFETMIFGGDHDGFQDRYTTYEQAEAGHAAVVRALHNGTDPAEATT